MSAPTLLGGFAQGLLPGILAASVGSDQEGKKYMVTVSVFAHLDAPSQDILVRHRRTATMLPRARGVYALYDRFGDLLYVGKASNLKSRVQSHLRAGKPAGLFPDWRRRVTWIEARLAAGETEALLIEADLIGKLAPPLNRRMRSWSRYCYLAATDNLATPLAISCQTLPWRRCFGPYRTRRQALATCDAIFRAVRKGKNEAGRLAQAYALLAGQDDSLAAEAEALCQPVTPHAPQDRRSLILGKQALTLRQAFDRGRLLGMARRMFAAMLVIHGYEVPGLVASITPEGLCIDTVGDSESSAKAFLRRYRRRTRVTDIRPDQPLPKKLADILCVAARRSAQARPDFHYVSADRAAAMSPSDVLALVRLAEGSKVVCRVRPAPPGT